MIISMLLLVYYSHNIQRIYNNLGKGADKDIFDEYIRLKKITKIKYNNFLDFNLPNE